VTVNASSYARAFYEHAGFCATAEEQEKDGIRFIPMTRRIVV
jgi:predicted GNAT family N-acyltransferase